MAILANVEGQPELAGCSDEGGLYAPISGLSHDETDGVMQADCRAQFGSERMCVPFVVEVAIVAVPAPLSQVCREVAHRREEKHGAGLVARDMAGLFVYLSHPDAIALRVEPVKGS